MQTVTSTLSPTPAKIVVKKRKRANEADRRKVQTTLTADLSTVDASKRPSFADVAREWKNQCQLECSNDWLRDKVRTRWEEITGVRAARRANPKAKQPRLDAGLPALLIPSKQEQCNVDLKEWHKQIEALWPQQPPRPLLLSTKSQCPKDVQDDFRLKMLNYWSPHPQSLKYSNPLDPLSNVANEVLRYYKGHRDPKGRVLPGISNPCIDLIEIVQERAQRAEKAKSKGGIAGKKQHSLPQYLQPSTGDVASRLPSEPVHVERTTVDVPPPPPHVEPSNVAWWKEQCGGQDREVVSQTGFSAEICEQLWLKYGDRVPLKERQNLLAVLVSLKMSPTEGQLPRVLPGASRFVRINEIKEAFAYLADIVDDIQWDNRLSHLIRAKFVRVSYEFT